MTFHSLRKHHRNTSLSQHSSFFSLPFLLPPSISGQVPSSCHVGVWLEHSSPLCTSSYQAHAAPTAAPFPASSPSFPTPAPAPALLSPSPSPSPNPCPPPQPQHCEINKNLTHYSRVQTKHFYSTCNTPANLTDTSGQINTLNATLNIHHFSACPNGPTHGSTHQAQGTRHQTPGSNP